MTSPAGSSGTNLSDFDNFELVEVLSCYAESKTCAIHATYTDSKSDKNVNCDLAGCQKKLDAVILLEKCAFGQSELVEWLRKLKGFENVMYNDIYSVFKAPHPADFDGIKITLIAPASDRHIEKYRSQSVHFVTETVNVYNTVIEPYVEKLAVKSKLQWVYNWLEHKAEMDRIIFEDLDSATGFIVGPDMKWDGKHVDNLYLQVVVRRRDLRSLRDLTGDHIPLLTNILESVPAAATKAYPKIGKTQLRFYLHYPPSYYHLHVHCVNAAYGGNGVAQSVGQAILLQDVIENLKSDGNYYQKRTLFYGLKSNHPLYEEMLRAGVAEKM